MTRTPIRSTAAIILALSALTACGNRDTADSSRSTSDSVVSTTSSGGTISTDEVDIEGLELGRTVGMNGKIADTMDEFRRRDTIIAIVETDDNESGKELVARWTYGDSEQLIEEQRQTIAMGTDARTVFRLTKPTAWAVGTYQVRIMHNGKELKSERFSVK